MKFTILVILTLAACGDPLLPLTDAGMTLDVLPLFDAGTPDLDAGPLRECRETFAVGSEALDVITWQRRAETTGNDAIRFEAELAPTEGALGFEVVADDPRTAIWITVYGCPGSNEVCADADNLDRSIDPPIRSHRDCTVHGTGRAVMGVLCPSGSPSRIRVVARSRAWEIPKDDPLHCSPGITITGFPVSDPHTPSRF